MNQTRSGIEGTRVSTCLDQIAAIIALRECEEDTRKICAIYQAIRSIKKLLKDSG